MTKGLNGWAAVVRKAGTPVMSEFIKVNLSHRCGARAGWR